jgi:hypothetical protein
MRTREAGEVFGPRMTLFADVLSVGLATSVACLPLVTAPAAQYGARRRRPTRHGRAVLPPAAATAAGR